MSVSTRVGGDYGKPCRRSEAGLFDWILDTICSDVLHRVL